MRTISVALASHLAGEVLTIATLWKVTRVDGTVFGFTDHDQDLTVSGTTYDAETGYTRSAVRASLGLQVDNLEVQGVLDASSITADDLRAGIWDYATVEVFLCNWADLTQGTLQLGKGRIGQVKSGRNTFTVELRGLSQHLQQTVGRLYMPTCDADLGDSRCGVVFSPDTGVPGTVTGVTSRRVFTASGLGALADGYFDYGKLTWTAGNNNNQSMEVKTYLNSGGAITLQLQMGKDIQVGDTFGIFAGCDKTFSTCGTKFSNAVNFQGFPHLPGMRRLVSGGG